MKKKFSFIMMGLISLNLIAQKSEACCNNYESALQKLNFNTTLLLETGELEPDLYYDYYKISKNDHIKRLGLYKQVLIDVLNFDLNFINFLSQFNDNKKNLRENWIKSINPYRSDVYGFYTEYEASLILIDYYLRGDHEELKKPEYFENLSIKKVQRFLKKHKTCSKDYIRESYKKWVIQLGN